jgi:ectoine hydroxylase-related dioxygenase (phytanoyl-CoA dioxygenase family)
VITRTSGYLRVRPSEGNAAAADLETNGYSVLRAVFSPEEVAELRADIDRVFAATPPDERTGGKPEGHWEPFRYEMLNRSAACQRAVAHQAILDAIEPLLGEDCHIIANTAWRQPAGRSTHGGQYWHIDSGPHIPRPAGVPWDVRIPYPVFAVATHIMLADCPPESGPTAVIPGSHTSGQAPPFARLDDVELTYDGREAVPLVLEAGDVALFASDVWHRRMPTTAGDTGRYFLQVHYGRRDLAQRLRPTSVAHQLSPEAVARATTPRQRTLAGLHEPGFYDG